jgi:hypothetical protein
VDSLERAQENAAHYKLIAVANAVIAPGNIAPKVWRLTFKRRDLIPETADDEIGKGGELFVEVDLSTKRARLVAYGE